VPKDRIVSVKIPGKLLEAIDEEVTSSGFTGRSDMIKTAIRFYIQNQHEKRVWEKENQADTPPPEIEKIKTM